MLLLLSHFTPENQIHSENDEVIIGEPVLTRYERARIIGARALQIAHGAPILIGTDENDFLITAAEQIFDHGIRPKTKKSEAQKRFELDCKISDFEMKYGIHNLEETKSLTKIPARAFLAHDKDELEVLEYLLQYNSDHAKKVEEQKHCWIAYMDYKVFSEEHKDFVSKQHEMFHLMSRLESKVEHCRY